MWFPENTMDATSTKTMSKKDSDQYLESTMIAVFRLKRFETQVLVPDIKAAYISLVLFNNMDI